jgi:ABC-type polar amino acid transport system ATPase subunit
MDRAATHAALLDSSALTSDRLEVEQGTGADRSILTVRRLRKRFEGTEAVRDVDLTIAQGEVAFIIGPSGGGKTTVLRCINFLETPNGGTIHFAGKTLCYEDEKGFHTAPEREIRRARTEMPMVFQHFNLFNHRTVLENVIEGPTVVLKHRREQAIEEARAVLARVGLSDKLDAYPAQLSGGQKQRVGIARALAMRPRLILFDEPTSSLDPELVAGVLDTIRGLAEEGMTMIVVSHEMGFVRRLADSVYFVADGIVLESGSPQRLLERPASDRLRVFMQSVLH